MFRSLELQADPRFALSAGWLPKPMCWRTHELNYARDTIANNLGGMKLKPGAEAFASRSFSG